MNGSILIIAASIAIALLWWGITSFLKYLEQKRKEMILTAEQIGLQLDDEKPSKKAIDTKPKYANELSKKNARLRYLFVGSIGEDGLTIRIFQHGYTISTGQSAYTIYHRAGYVRCPEDWPTTRICTRRKGKMKFGTWKKKNEITLENDEFNRRFMVKSFDPDFAVTLLNPDLQEALLSVDKKIAGAWHIESGRLWYLEKGSMTPLSLPLTMKHFRLFVDYIYPELWR